MLTATLLFSSLAGCSTATTPSDDGCPGAVYPDWQTSSYVLPYPVGTSVRTDLTNCSGSYHSEGLADAFAYDFGMNIGTVITASRDGTVIHVEESGVDGFFPNNLVVVDHGDSTYAEYMHLTLDGAFVDVGQTVQRGDTLGLSGATGLAGYPHLHLVVVGGAWEFPYVSTPITFSNTTANPRGLASGQVYEALSY